MLWNFAKTWRGGDESWSRELGRNETVKLSRGASGQWLRVDAGQLLVTLEGDLEDHVLGPGEELVLASGGLAVAWALEASRVAGGELHGLRVLRAGSRELDERHPAAA